MAPRHPRDQRDLFYTPRWSAFYEQEFIHRLSEYALRTSETIKRSDILPIRNSIDFVNEKYGTNFTYKEAHQFFKQLQHRHTVFGFIVTLPRVIYDVQRNYVQADPFIWDYVTMKYPLAEAYMIQGECQWMKLCSVFGNPIPVDVFAEPDVIQISDDQSIPARAGSSNHYARPPRNPRREDSHPTLSPSFWNNLGKIAGASDVSSQDSVHYIPPSRPHNHIEEPSVATILNASEVTRRNYNNLCAPASCGRPGPTGSYASSSGTPKKPKK